MIRRVVKKMKKEEIEKIKILNFNYELPDERIAKYPLDKRDDSRILIYDNHSISSSLFFNLAYFIPQNSLMIFNNTRVIHARLIFRKPTGASIEVFCLSPCYPAEYNLNFQQKKGCSWYCMIGNSKRWKDDVMSMTLFSDKEIVLTAKKIGIKNNDTIVEFNWNDDSYSFSEILEIAGKLPIPPYLNRDSEEKDDFTYQTVYSSVDGSVAAPTAGLHFTDEVFQKLHDKGIKTDEVTLHVGAGTFKPVKSEIIGEHDMHTEFISVSKDTIKELRDNKGKLIVVGTTSTRTIESLYFIGKKLETNPSAQLNQLTVSQWDPYEDNGINISPQKALQNILDYLENNNMESLISATQIMIAPGYKFAYCDAIITNFHQPQSTLLLLISAFVGDDWKKIYNYALSNGFRFLSYGDSSLLWKA
jgi:S-adenosylmethionine:tRNA ribosyltransferase-isomerase